MGDSDTLVLQPPSATALANLQAAVHPWAALRDRKEGAASRPCLHAARRQVPHALFGAAAALYPAASGLGMHRLAAIWRPSKPAGACLLDMLGDQPPNFPILSWMMRAQPTGKAAQQLQRGLPRHAWQSQTTAAQPPAKPRTSCNRCSEAHLLTQWMCAGKVRVLYEARSHVAENITCAFSVSDNAAGLLDGFPASGKIRGAPHPCTGGPSGRDAATDHTWQRRLHPRRQA